MANNFNPLQAQPFLLAGSGAVIGDTSLVLQSFNRIDGTPITMTMLGLSAYMTLEPGNGTQEEQIVFTGVNQNTNGTATLTGVSDVAMQSPYTQTSGLLITHAGATTAILSNTSGFYSRFVAKDDDGTISETITFTQPNFPQMDGTTTPPSLPAQLVTKAYADSLSFAGAPNASTSTKGIVQIATQSQVDAKTIIGSTSAFLVQPLNTQRSTLLSDYIVDTGSPNVIVITPSPAITSYIAGQAFSFKLANTNTSPTVSINVNGLGVQQVTKLNGITSPSVGDMASGQLITVEYDGTNFQMLNPVANVPATSAQVTALQKFGGTGTDGALTATTGTTTINLGNAAIFTKNYTSISLTGTANLAFTNPATGGTLIILKSQGNVTITTSTSPVVSLTGLGGVGGTGLVSGAPAAGNPGSAFGQWVTGTIAGGTGGTNGNPGGGLGGASASAGTGAPAILAGKQSDGYIRIPVVPGSGGGAGGNSSGSGTSGAGGIGAGALYIECAGSLNITSTFTANATNGSNTASGGDTGGGGGGGGGYFFFIYNTLTANSAVFSANGGSGGTGGGSTGGSAGGAGANGGSTVVQNTLYV